MPKIPDPPLTNGTAFLSAPETKYDFCATESTQVSECYGENVFRCHKNEKFQSRFYVNIFEPMAIVTGPETSVTQVSRCELTVFS